MTNPGHMSKEYVRHLKLLKRKWMRDKQAAKYDRRKHPILQKKARMKVLNGLHEVLEGAKEVVPKIGELQEKMQTRSDDITYWVKNEDQWMEIADALWVRNQDEEQDMESLPEESGESTVSQRNGDKSNERIDSEFNEEEIEPSDESNEANEQSLPEYSYSFGDELNEIPYAGNGEKQNEEESNEEESNEAIEQNLPEFSNYFGNELSEENREDENINDKESTECTISERSTDVSQASSDDYHEEKHHQNLDRKSVRLVKRMSKIIEEKEEILKEENYQDDENEVSARDNPVEDDGIITIDSIESSKLKILFMKVDQKVREECAKRLGDAIDERKLKQSVTKAYLRQKEKTEAEVVQKNEPDADKNPDIITIDMIPEESTELRILFMKADQRARDLVQRKYGSMNEDKIKEFVSKAYLRQKEKRNL